MTRSIRVRFSRKSRGGAPPGDAEDPAEGSGAEPGDAFQEFDPFPEGAPILPDPSLTAAERAEAEEEASQGIPTSAARAPSPGERRVEGRFQEAMAWARSRAEEALARSTRGAARGADPGHPGRGRGCPRTGPRPLPRRRSGRLSADRNPAPQRADRREGTRRLPPGARDSRLRHAPALHPGLGVAPDCGCRRRNDRKRIAAARGVHRGGRIELALCRPGHRDECRPPRVARGGPDLPTDARRRSAPAVAAGRKPRAVSVPPPGCFTSASRTTGTRSRRSTLPRPPPSSIWTTSTPRWAKRAPGPIRIRRRL